MSSHSLEMVPLFRPWLAELLRSLVVLGSVARAFTTFQNLDLSLFLPPFILRGFCVFFQGESAVALHSGSLSFWWNEHSQGTLLGALSHILATAGLFEGGLFLFQGFSDVLGS